MFWRPKRHMMPVEPTPAHFQTRFAANHLVTGEVLAEVLEGLPPEIAETALHIAIQIVLAEVINNIIDHAYRDTLGQIELKLWHRPQGVQVMIHDQGQPMPLEHGPQTRLSAPDPHALPERGFGWLLIRSLAHDLRYTRLPDGNQLSFQLSLPHLEQVTKASHRQLNPATSAL